MKLVKILILLSFVLTACGTNSNSKEVKEMKNKIRKLAKTELKYEHSLLDDNQKKVVKNLVLAAKEIDKIFMDQVYEKNQTILDELRKSDDEVSKLKLDYFSMMVGPFDRLDLDKPFYGIDPKPAGANFYPTDMTKEEFEKFIKQNPKLESEFTSEFTVIRRVDGKLVAIPYSEYYRENLTLASDYLKEAAKYADNKSLKKYLLSRADAFLSNDYFQSDMDWMDLNNHTIEVIIGPYEVYEDAMFNYKASFECFLTLVDPVESDKLKKFASYLVDMEKHLPIPEKYKNYDRGSDSPIMVVQEVFSAGDTKAGVQTLAFNLPNDERVRKAKGSKKVMLKNVHEAKFAQLLMPIAKIVLDDSQLPYVTFDGFFNHTLMHEMSHGIGPGFITKNGKATEVKKELKETYSKIEECKADILGMWNNVFMIEKGVYKPEFEKEIWATFLAGTFRSMRFGINEAHGGGTAIIYNYMLQNGAYEFDAKTEKVKVNYSKALSVLKSLANKLLIIQAQGDYDGAKKLIATYGIETETMTQLIAKLSNLPVDIYPVFEIEKELN